MLQGLQHVVSADREDAATAPTRDVSERMGEKGFADTDRTDDGDVRMGVEKTQHRELIQQRTIEGDLRGWIPRVQVHGGIQPRALDAEGDGKTVPTRRLVAEDEQQEILVRHFLLTGEQDALRQRIESPPPV